MQLIKNQEFKGERPLFGICNTRLEDVIITSGESAIKCCENLEVDNCKFYGKYPLWHIKNSLISNCYFAPNSRSAIWYCDDMSMQNCIIDAPKFFREMTNLDLKNVLINDGDESFWRVNGLNIENVELKDGTYPFMFCQNIKIDHLKSDAKYLFQYTKNAQIRNIKITTKDAFWESENVSIYDSELNGEYLGWHSKNLRLVNCHISGEQPLCYAQNLILENCTFGSDCELMFEDSSLQASIKSDLKSVKNPRSGCIIANSYGKIIIDENIKSPANCELKTWK